MCLVFYRSNQDSTTDLRTAIADGGLEVFDRFYVCFAALRQTWIKHCRPIFGIDGCFLKSTTKGQLLAAVGRDANNQIFPIAWAVVNVEETESWVWFIQLLKKDFNLKNGDGFTLVSYRQKVRFWLMWNSFFIFSDFIYVTFFILGTVKGSGTKSYQRLSIECVLDTSMET